MTAALGLLLMVAVIAACGLLAYEWAVHGDDDERSWL